MGFFLKQKKEFRIPLEADAISPDIFAGKSIGEIKKLEVYEGNVKRPLTEFFEINKDASPEDLIQIDGELRNVKYIGANMSSGKIIINGDVGLQLGSEMKGGEIEVNGNVSSWVGMEMSGGRIIIHGNAGDYIGCAYRGDWRGMQGGEIIIEKSAGSNIGGGMLDGFIHVKGSINNFCGIRMKGGEIIIEGDSGRAAGAEMTGGKITICGKVEAFLPGFEYSHVEKEHKNNLMVFNGDYSEIKPVGVLSISMNRNRDLINPVEEQNEITDNGLKVILNSGSTIREGEIIKGGRKLSQEYIDECATCYINPEDYAKLDNPEKVIVTFEENEVVVRAISDPATQVGAIFIPRGIWANAITPPYTESTGSPMYKGVDVYIKKASVEDRIISPEEIIESME